MIIITGTTPTIIIINEYLIHNSCLYGGLDFFTGKVNNGSLDWLLIEAITSTVAPGTSIGSRVSTNTACGVTKIIKIIIIIIIIIIIML